MKTECLGMVKNQDGSSSLKFRVTLSIWDKIAVFLSFLFARFLKHKSNVNTKATHVQHNTNKDLNKNEQI